MGPVGARAVEGQPARVAPVLVPHAEAHPLPAGGLGFGPAPTPARVILGRGVARARPEEGALRGGCVGAVVAVRVLAEREGFVTRALRCLKKTKNKYTSFLIYLFFPRFCYACPAQRETPCKHNWQLDS